MVALTALGTAYVTAPDMKGRADECLGNTTPITRGMMLNRCDHAISVLACPQASQGRDCALQDVEATATFDIRSDIPVIAHACARPYVAVMLNDTDGGVRRCVSPE